jgi:hypothetical protein
MHPMPAKKQNKKQKLKNSNPLRKGEEEPSFRYLAYCLSTLVLFILAQLFHISFTCIGKGIEARMKLRPFFLFLVFYSHDPSSGSSARQTSKRQ